MRETMAASTFQPGIVAAAAWTAVEIKCTTVQCGMLRFDDNFTKNKTASYLQSGKPVQYSNYLFRCQRPQVSGNCDNVVLGQMCDRTLHQLDRFTSARTILNIEKLSRNI